ncbi:MAG: hypothetical protein Rubg2KO_13360 [Rubricoccaceae bacterium]
MGTYPALLVGYGLALSLWLLLSQRSALWPPSEPVEFEHPWREIGYALLACVGVLAMGQLWSAGLRLPTDGPAGPALDALNQGAIFSPLAVLLIARRQTLATAWVPTTHVWTRLTVGLALALVALLGYLAVRERAGDWAAAVVAIYHPRNGGLFVQVFLEDILIAILAVRFRAALGPWRTAGLVAVLFAAGHIPAFLASGVDPMSLSTLILDAALGVGILLVLLRGRDILWFWMVHAALDVVQVALRSIS